MKKGITFIICMILSLTFVCSFAGAQEGQEVKGTLEGSVLRIGTTDPKAIGHFDTTGALTTDYNAYSQDLVFDVMLWKDSVSGEFKSNILADYNWDTETNSIVLTLKDGIYFSDGDQMTAEDLLYTFQRESQAFINSEMLVVMQLANAVISEDGLTLTIPCNNEYGPWRKFLMDSSGVHNKSWEEAHGGAAMDFDDPANICGSGPYRVAEYVIDASTTYVKRDDWWMEGQLDPGTSSFETIIVTAYRDTTTMMVDYELGAIDMAFGLTATDYDRIVADPSLGEAIAMPTNYVAMLNMDVDNTEALKDINLRKVIAYGIDWNIISALAFGSLQTPAVSSIPASNPAVVEGLVYTYDPEEAKRIVDENGLAGTELNWIAATGSTATIAETMQGMLAQYGITLNLEIVDMTSAIAKWMVPGATCFQVEGTANANSANDPFVQYQAMMKTSFLPCAAKKDPALNDLLDAARFTVDPEQRNEYYRQVQQYLYDNIYIIPFCEWSSACCYKTDVVSYANPQEVSIPLLRNIIPAAY